MSDTEFDTRLQNYLTEKTEVEDKAKEIEAEERQQKAQFQLKLFRLITSLTVISFGFLMLVVIFKMAWKIRHPDYDIISDVVINVLAVGVFAELVGVVGIIAKLLWQK